MDIKPLVQALTHEQIGVLSAAKQHAEPLSNALIEIFRKLEKKGVKPFEIPQYKAMAAESRFLSNVKNAGAVGSNGWLDGASLHSDTLKDRASTRNAISAFLDHFKNDLSEEAKASLNKAKSAFSGRISGETSGIFEQMSEHVQPEQSTAWRDYLKKREAKQVALVTHSEPGLTPSNPYSLSL